MNEPDEQEPGASEPRPPDKQASPKVPCTLADVSELPQDAQPQSDKRGQYSYTVVDPGFTAGQIIPLVTPSFKLEFTPRDHLGQLRACMEVATLRETLRPRRWVRVPYPSFVAPADLLFVPILRGTSVYVGT